MTHESRVRPMHDFPPPPTNWPAFSQPNRLLKHPCSFDSTPWPLFLHAITHGNTLFISLLDCLFFCSLIFMFHHFNSLVLSPSEMAPLSLFSILVPFLLCLTPTLSTNSEGNALHALRSRLFDPNNVLQSWDPNLVNPCTWFHITCDDSNHVIRLDLGNSNISGTLGSELGELKHLQYLLLYRNEIGGKIPKELGNLKNLISIDLYENRLEGEIPKSLAKLESLRFLRLNNNKLTGSIPRELTGLSNLNVLDVSNNNLCGTIPVDGPFATFPLKSFENNRLNGPELKGLVPYDFGC